MKLCLFMVVVLTVLWKTSTAYPLVDSDSDIDKSYDEGEDDEYVLQIEVEESEEPDIIKKGDSHKKEKSEAISSRNSLGTSRSFQGNDGSDKTVSKSNNHAFGLSPLFYSPTWGPASVEAAYIKQILDEENDVGISFDELTKLQEQFGRRLGKSSKKNFFNSKSETKSNRRIDISPETSVQSTSIQKPEAFPNVVKVEIPAPKVPFTRQRTTTTTTPLPQTTTTTTAAPQTTSQSSIVISDFVPGIEVQLNTGANDQIIAADSASHTDGIVLLQVDLDPVTSIISPSESSQTNINNVGDQQNKNDNVQQAIITSSDTPSSVFTFSFSDPSVTEAPVSAPLTTELTTVANRITLPPSSTTTEPPSSTSPEFSISIHSSPFQKILPGRRPSLSSRVVTEAPATTEANHADINVATSTTAETTTTVPLTITEASTELTTTLRSLFGRRPASRRTTTTTTTEAASELPVITRRPFAGRRQSTTTTSTTPSTSAAETTSSPVTFNRVIPGRKISKNRLKLASTTADSVVSSTEQITSTTVRSRGRFIPRNRASSNREISDDTSKVNVVPGQGFASTRSRSRFTTTSTTTTSPSTAQAAILETETSTLLPIVANTDALDSESIAVESTELSKVNVQISEDTVILGFSSTDSTDVDITTTVDEIIGTHTDNPSNEFGSKVSRKVILTL